MRDLRHRRQGRSIARRQAADRDHDLGHATPRPRRRGLLFAGTSAWATAASASSTWPAAPADRQRGRLGRGRLQRRDLQLPGAARASSKRRGHRFRDRQRHRGDRPRLRGVGRGCVEPAAAACSPSRSGTRRDGRCSWRATGWARSRSTTTTPSGGSSSPRELKALLARSGALPRDSTRRRSTTTSPTATSPPTAASSAACSKLPPGHCAALARRAARGRRYWAAAARRARHGERSESAERARRESARAVRLAPGRATCPLGVFLSGGIDSSTVVAPDAARSRRGR